MKYIRKIATACLGALTMLTLTGCEGSELYNVLAPDWLAGMGGGSSDEQELEGMMEDVYTVGNTDYSSPWWSAFSKYYVVPAGEKWCVQFNLNINPKAPNTYKNFVLIMSSDADRGDAAYSEYGAIRYDHQPSGNSEWGDYVNRNNVTSTLTFNTDTDEGIDRLGGKVTLIVDRTDGAISVSMDNGSVTKTFTQAGPWPTAEAAEQPMRCYFVAEGSYIDFLATNIEPIGGCTWAEDKDRVSMTLKVPAKVLQGTDYLSNITATVEFEEGVTKNVTADELSFQVVPDATTLGSKTLVAIYNKTFKGEYCSPITATATFSVVDKMYTCIGETNNTTAFWGAHSEMIKVNPGETFVTSFTNYTSGVNNFNNFLVVLSNAAGTTEYGVLRADNWGWGTGWGGEDLASKCTPSGGQTDWAAWLAAMDGAKVTVYVTNNGNGTADVKTVMVGNDGNTYKQDYIGLNTVTNPNDFYFRFTVDNCHLEFDNVIGAEDNSGAFWSAHSEKIQVPAGKTYVTRFKNFTSGANNYSNFITVLSNAAGTTEYGVLRADNWGWGTGWGGEDLTSKCTPSGGQTNWATWLAAMDGAMVTVYITNKGNGTADVKTVMVGNDGNTYKQDYIGLNTVTNANDFYFRFTVEACHLVFE